MNIQDFHTLCISLPGVTEHFPFDKDTLVFKVGGKMFALTSLSSWEKGERKANLKCNPERALELREQHDGITPGYHMSKIHWNTVQLGNDVSDSLFIELLHHSYDLVRGSLPRKIRADIEASAK